MAFVFTVNERQIFSIHHNHFETAVKHYPNFGPVFGDDIVVYDKCNESQENYSDFGKSYELLRGLKYDANMVVPLLSGTYQFKVKEIEVY